MIAVSLLSDILLTIVLTINKLSSINNTMPHAPLMHTHVCVRGKPAKQQITNKRMSGRVPSSKAWPVTQTHAEVLGRLNRAQISHTPEQPR